MTSTGLISAPAPWDLTGKSWIVPIYTPFSETPIPLPRGSYAPLEKGSTCDQSDRFHGGCGVVMVLRYESSAVGPYDELIYIPGLFSRKSTAGEKVKYHFSITRIYVSEDVSTINGRRNWSIPKHRASFKWSELPRGGTLVEVSHPTSPNSSFFRAVFSNSALTPFAVPVSTSWFDWPIARWLLSGYEGAIYQPSLTGVSETSDRDKVESTKKTGQDLDALVGSRHTYSLKPSSTGRSRITTVEVAPSVEGKETEDWSEFGDGDGFPRFKPAKEGPLRGRGVHLTDIKMSFPLPVTVQE
ncbi:hypothetical protein JCM11641_006089 [Rhodosporidiobolus odoratus]